MSDTTDNAAFDLDDLDLGSFTVSAMTDSTALPEGHASYQSSSTCYVASDEVAE